MDILNGGTDKINFLHQRELARQLNLQKKQESKTLAGAENEQIDFFEKSFVERQYHIQHMIDQSKGLPKENLPEHFNNITKEILILQKYVAASSIFLHSYFVKKCQNIIQQLNDTVAELENQLLPKKKFGFKKKLKTNITNDQIHFPTKDSNGTTNIQSGFVETLSLSGQDVLKKDVVLERVDKHMITNVTIDEVDFQARDLNGTAKVQCGFVDRTNETLSLSGEDILKKDVILERLSNCTVFLTGVPSTLFLNHLENCRVFSGPVSTSIFAENCQKSTLIIACQQLRLHSSKDVNIYLHVTSRAIMEDCSEIHFAPYNWWYHGIETDFEVALLQKSVNNWKCIDDFNWLNADRHSPNWSEIEEKDLVVEWK